MELAGVIGYGLAALAFTALALLLAVGWEGRFNGLSLVLASGLTGLWTATLATFAWLESAATGSMGDRLKVLGV